MTDGDDREIPDFHDVLIAGAGPVGLLLACELGLAGRSVLVLEREADTAAPFRRLPFGLRGLNAPSLDALDRRSLLDPLVAAARWTEPFAHWRHDRRRPGGHFAGIPFFEDDIDEAAWPHRLPRPAGDMLPIELAALETLLADRAESLGVEIRRGHAVESVEASEDGVTVAAGGAICRGAWLVGCDGARSVVRRAAGFAFAGTDPEFTGWSIDAELADPAVLRAGRHATPAGTYTFAPPGMIGLVEFDGGAAHRKGALTADRVEAVLRRVADPGAAIRTLHQAATWTDRAHQVTEYRRGRVLLAGDAAHIHSPLGGQGLNLGLGDAANLGWKLAATLRGDAPRDLLESYADERAPLAAAVLDWSRAQVLLMRPEPAARALAAVVAELAATRDGATLLAGRIRGVAQRPGPAGDHPLVGRDVPAFALAGGTRPGILLRQGRGLLLEFASSAPDPALAAVAGGWRARIDHVAAAAADTLGLACLLVRPDGVVAWAGATTDPAPVAAAASRWFGAPLDP